MLLYNMVNLNLTRQVMLLFSPKDDSQSEMKPIEKTEVSLKTSIYYT